MSSDTQPDASEHELKFTFPDMRLRVGDRVQLQLPSSLGDERVFSKVVGYLDNVSLLVSTPLTNGYRALLRENDKIVVRVFSSQKAFAFDCYVIKVNSVPFSYLHLSYPEKIQGSVVRKDPRIKVRIIASVKKAGSTDPDEKFSVVVTNLSAAGALITTPRPLFEKNQQLLLSFQIKLHHVDMLMTINCIVRNISEDEHKNPNDPHGAPTINHGLQFIDVEPNSTILLQSLIYQQMIEQPQTVI
ncbi:flagellar brake protein [Undibacterium sp. Jales W-56]|uniref:flagellar brake protein n=1 Tax=Undibacterium sp. Jales W-56 TaxID=2897325 RepID=UPI0021D1F6E9|nr:flagellar brake protein [Undibacterium sp. Jales W-56]MCU6435615.1 flagellar brake protein [Undibacterium sp. Jales W-56]